MADKEEAVWKTYPGIDFLQANQFGEVRTIDHYTECKDGRKRLVKGHVLKQCSMKNGYMMIDVNINRKHKRLYVHRVVASCFLPNPDNLPEVNHKDCNKKNNSVENLEWCTRQYNNTYKEKYGISAKEATKALREPLFAVNLETLKVSRFVSQREAARQLGISQSNIWAVLRGKACSAGGCWFTENKNEITKEKIQEIKDRKSNDGSKPVIAVNLKTFKVSRFKSRSEAARQLGVSAGNICNVFKGHYKQAGGYWFCNADESGVEKAREKFGDAVANRVEELINDKL